MSLSTLAALQAFLGCGMTRLQPALPPALQPDCQQRIAPAPFALPVSRARLRWPSSPRNFLVVLPPMQSGPLHAWRGPDGLLRLLSVLLVHGDCDVLRLVKSAGPGSHLDRRYAEGRRPLRTATGEQAHADCAHCEQKDHLQAAALLESKEAAKSYRQCRPWNQRVGLGTRHKRGRGRGNRDRPRDGCDAVRRYAHLRAGGSIGQSAAGEDDLAVKSVQRRDRRRQSPALSRGDRQVLRRNIEGEVRRN